jgi:hypothetical protein
MNLLIVGAGKGSFQIRGDQLGAALGARVVNVPSPADWRWADLAILVKRAATMFGRQARQAGVPIVWDALDFWRQPSDNRMSADEAVRLLADRQAEIQPDLTIGATEAMAKVCGGVYLPHHYWPGLTPTPARERVHVVAYEGNPQYLGKWHIAIERACLRRGWRFHVNPPDLRSADILVAFRDGIWDGWMCREWKSGVKLVNAMAAGRPILTQESAAFREIQPAGSIVTTPDQLDAAFDAWAHVSLRQAVVEQSIERSEAFLLSSVAARYIAILQDVRARCAA